MSSYNSFDPNTLNVYSALKLNLNIYHRVIDALADHLFVDNKSCFEDIVYIADQTGIDANHLHDVFWGVTPMSLFDYIVLANYAEFNPIADLV